MTTYLHITFVCCGATRLVTSPLAEDNARTVHHCGGTP